MSYLLYSIALVWGMQISASTTSWRRHGDGRISSGEEPPAAKVACQTLQENGAAGVVAMPSSAIYKSAISKSYNTLAQEVQPPCVVTPSSSAQVASLLREAAGRGASVTVRGGGHTKRCINRNAIMVDMSNLQEVSYQIKQGVANNNSWFMRAQGGAHMGDILAAGRVAGQGIPVGASPLPGFGLLLQGGVGYLARKDKLTIDSITAVELAVPSGEVLYLGPSSTGLEAELWWAVRGAAPHFGIVTAAELSTTNVSGGIYVRVAVYDTDIEGRLAMYLATATSLPREVSVHLMMTWPSADATAPVIALYATAWPATPEDHPAKLVDDALDPFGEPSYVMYGDIYPYGETPELDIPSPPSSDAQAASSASGSSGAGDAPRLYGGTASMFVRPPRNSSSVASTIIKAIQMCPSRLCRIDMQQAGGAVGEVLPSEMAFGLRDWEWNMIFYASWHEGTSLGNLEFRWLKHAMSTLDSVPRLIAGIYAVDIANHGPLRPKDEYVDEVARAYGSSGGEPHITRLCTLKEAIDPGNVLGNYYSLCPPQAIHQYRSQKKQ